MFKAMDQNVLNYERVEKAIAFIRANALQQPSLAEIADAVHVSPHHFQRIFVEWAGVSPKKFLQYLSLNHAKQLIINDGVTLFDAAHEVGLSASSRLHDLFVNIEGMTPGEYKNGGALLTINYSKKTTCFGYVVIASTAKGVCFMGFDTPNLSAFTDLRNRFPNATFVDQFDDFQDKALGIFKNNWTDLSAIKLHLKGTEFQLKVWRALLNIPSASLSTYGQLANDLGNAKASRAVGTAIGSNPIAYLIPCHRVIQSSGHLGGYMWDVNRKSALIAWESAQYLGEK